VAAELLDDVLRGGERAQGAGVSNATVAAALGAIGLYGDRPPFDDVDVEEAVRRAGWSNLCRAATEEARITFLTTLGTVKRERSGAA
jgi:hypothetical protein